jgi:hypothetical protein
MRPVRTACALVVGTALLTACAEAPAQHAARLEVERVSQKAGRGGDTKCTSNPHLLFSEGPKASVFVCLVKTGGGVCDRYVVDKGTARLQAREADCILPGGT